LVRTIITSFIGIETQKKPKNTHTRLSSIIYLLLKTIKSMPVTSIALIIRVSTCNQIVLVSSADQRARFTIEKTTPVIIIAPSKVAQIQNARDNFIGKLAFITLSLTHNQTFVKGFLGRKNLNEIDNVHEMCYAHFITLVISLFQRKNLIKKATPGVAFLGLHTIKSHFDFLVRICDLLKLQEFQTFFPLVKYQLSYPTQQLLDNHQFHY